MPIVPILIHDGDVTVKVCDSCPTPVGGNLPEKLNQLYPDAFWGISRAYKPTKDDVCIICGQPLKRPLTRITRDRMLLPEEVARNEKVIEQVKKDFPPLLDTLSKIIDILREQGVTIDSPYDFENFFTDNATHTNLMRTHKFDHLLGNEEE